MHGRKRVVATTIGLAIALTAFSAMPAVADHGWDTFRFRNKIPKKEKQTDAYGITILFDREISHVEGHSWPDAKCAVRPNKLFVDCESKRPIARGENFDIAVAPPPPETQANVERWRWMNKKGKFIGDKDYRGCGDEKGNCDDITDGSEPPPFGRP